MVAARGDPDVLARLADLVDGIDRAVTKGPAGDVFAADMAFHRALVEAAGNRSLEEVFARYVPTLRALLRLDEHVYRRLDDIAKEHRPLIEALRSGDAAAAADLAEQHCDHAGDLISAYVESLETADA